MRKNLAMEHEAIKLELSEGLTQLDDDATSNYLKIVKDEVAQRKIGGIFK